MKTKFYMPISKVDEEQRLVWGYASTERKDNQGEVTKLDAVAKALDEYMEFANIREMHKPNAVGVCKEAELKDDGLYICAKVVDDPAWEKVKEGVYKGFSIGGTGKRENGEIVGLRMTEISLVDRPANPDCVIDLWKMEGGEELGKEDVQKGMYSVSSLANLLDSLNSLRMGQEWEAKNEGDNSQIPAKLKEAVNNLAGILVEMTQEEVAELTADTQKMDSATNVAKAGARNSKQDADKIQAVHDHAVALGATCGKKEEEANKLDKKTDVAKADFEAEVKKMLDPLTDTIQKLSDGVAKFDAAVTKMDAIEERLTKLESQPEPAKARVISVSKADDTGVQAVAKLDEVDPNQLAMQIKASQNLVTSAY